jgi:hypothetical protein
MIGDARSCRRGPVHTGVHTARVGCVHRVFTSLFWVFDDFALSDLAGEPSRMKQRTPMCLQLLPEFSSSVSTIFCLRT